ncbi:MAG: zinc ribbon domain-containing protein [Proteobacteria bacterium]|nr:zinc ribbon domain-containing protein [Pseudomonadota bacterium]MBU1686476.1 zinc ribbon domain-containing protein [Pseudomonadota bacterium]
MPLFDFICQKCGKEFEELVSGSIKPVCPFCGSSNLKKLMSSFAYRSQGKGNGSSSSSGSQCSGCAGGSCSSCH